MDAESQNDRDKDISDNDDRPPPDSSNTVQWDFIRFGLRQRSVESRLLDMVSDKYKRKPRLIGNKLVVLGSTEV